MKANLISRHIRVLLAALAVACLGAIAWGQEEAFDAQEIFGGNAEIESVNYEFETKDGKLSRLIFKDEVKIVSDKMNATCNYLTYDVSTGRLVAVGNPVNIKQQDVKARCGNFEYFPKEGKAVLTGNPIVWQRSEDRDVESRGDVIKIFQSESGDQRVLVESSKKSRLTIRDLQSALNTAKPKDETPQSDRPANFTMTTKAPAQQAKPVATPAAPVRLDANSLDKIPEPNIEE